MDSATRVSTGTCGATSVYGRQDRMTVYEQHANPFWKQFKKPKPIASTVRNNYYETETVSLQRHKTSAKVGADERVHKTLDFNTVSGGHGFLHQYFVVFAFSRELFNIA